MNIKRTNKWDASIVYCKRHMPDHIKHLLGYPITETETCEPCPDCQWEQHNAEAPDRMKEALLSPLCVHTRYRNRVEFWDDERKIDNGIIVTLHYGWSFEPRYHEGVRGFDTVSEAKKAIANSFICHCPDCKTRKPELY